MNIASKYDNTHLIQVATIANEISRASSLSSKNAIQRLVSAVESGELKSDLYPPLQKWRHGGKPERVEVPIQNGADQWRNIAKQSASFHQSDKDEFRHPNSASTYHVLADDLFEYSKVCSIGALAKKALRQLAVRYNPELGIEQPAPAQTHAPVLDAPADRTLLATREQLIEAFGSFTGMNADWFGSIKDTPALLAARKVAGQGGRGHIAEPMFCPFEVMQWLIDPKRRKGRKLGQDKGWQLFESYFPRAYAAFSVGDSRTD